jgi:aryl-alcohol dehydrogenase-like predicted oxidoreductase
MIYSELGTSKIRVSLLCLGTMTWGQQNTEEDAFKHLDFACDMGINFIDTAEIYPVPPKAETFSLTEQFIGKWLKQKKNREKIVLATKISGPSTLLSWISSNKPCFSKEHIKYSLDNSLKRLKTDYIDLYQLHWPNRKSNFFGQLGFNVPKNESFIPISEILSFLQDFINKGKIRFIGLSNETPWGVMSFINEAKKNGFSKIVTIQNPYNLLNRSFEVGNAEISYREKVGLLAYSPLACGVLSGKYFQKNVPKNSRLTLFGKHFTRYNNERASLAAKKYINLAAKTGIKPAQLALSFVNSRSYLTSTIIGATNIEQLRENIESINVNLSKDILKEIEKIHLQNPNPAP